MGVRALLNGFQVREVGKNKIRIAGYANRFGEVDSYGTRFDPMSVNLERMKKNPILLFNHDTNYPVGKVTKLEPKEDGVWVEAEVSASNNPQISFVRDLVEEGCLKAFSMRFGDNYVSEKDPDKPGAMLIRNWEIQEVSIVSLPAQSESLFSLRSMQSAFKNISNKEEAKKMLENLRGVKAAKYVNECLVMAAKDVSREDIMERLRDRSGLEAGELQAVLEGDVTPLPDAFMSAAAEVLACDKDKLAELNAMDVEENKTPSETPADVEPPVIRAPTDDAVKACVSEKIPLLLKEGKPQDQAVAMAISMCSAERGCDGWRPSETEMQEFVRQAEAEPSAPVEPMVPNDNAMLQKLDSMVALLGSLVSEFKMLKDTLVKLGPVIEEKRESVEIEISSEDEKETEEQKIEDELDPETERALNQLWARVESRAQSLGL